MAWCRNNPRAIFLQRRTSASLRGVIVGTGLLLGLMAQLLPELQAAQATLNSASASSENRVALRNLADLLPTGQWDQVLILADRILSTNPEALFPTVAIPLSMDKNPGAVQGGESSLPRVAEQSLFRLKHEWYQELTPRQRQNYVQVTEAAAKQQYRDLPLDESRLVQLISFARQYDLTPFGIRAWEELAAVARDRGQPELAAAYYSHLAQHPLIAINPRQQQAFQQRQFQVIAEGIASSHSMDQKLRRQQILQRFQSVKAPAAVEVASTIIDDKLWFPQTAIHWEKTLEPVRSRYRARGISMFALQNVFPAEKILLQRVPSGILGFDAKTGKQAWHLPVPLLRKESLAGGMLNDADWSRLIAFEQSQTLWNQISIDYDQFYFVEPPASQTGRANQHQLCAASVETGKVLWRLGGPSKSESYPLTDCRFLAPPLVLDQSLVLLTEKHQGFWLHVIGRQHGGLEWSMSLGQLRQASSSSPILHRTAAALNWTGSRCLVTTGVGEVLSVNLAARSVDWRDGLPPIFTGTPAPQRPETPLGYVPDRWWHGWRQAQWLIDQQTIIGISPETQHLTAWSTQGRRLWSVAVPDGLKLVELLPHPQSPILVIVTANGLRGYYVRNGAVAWDLNPQDHFQIALKSTPVRLRGNSPFGHPGVPASVLCQNENMEQAWLLAPLENGCHLLINGITGQVLAMPLSTAYAPFDVSPGNSSTLTVPSLPAFSTSRFLQDLQVNCQSAALPVTSATSTHAIDVNSAEIRKLHQSLLRSGDFRAITLHLQQFAPEQLSQVWPGLTPAKAAFWITNQWQWCRLSGEKEQAVVVANLLERYLPELAELPGHYQIELANFWLEEGALSKAQTLLEAVSRADLVQCDEDVQPAMKLENLLRDGQTIVSQATQYPEGTEPEWFSALHGNRVLPSRRALAVALRLTDRIQVTSPGASPQNRWEHTAQHVKHWHQTDALGRDEFWAGTFLSGIHRVQQLDMLPLARSSLSDELAVLGLLDRWENSEDVSEARQGQLWKTLADFWQARGLLQEAQGAGLQAQRVLRTPAIPPAEPRTPVIQQPGVVLSPLRERNEDVYQIPIPITSLPGLPGDHLDVSIARSGAFLRFMSGSVDTPWIYGLNPHENSDISPLRQVWQLYSGHSVGRLLVLQVGTELMAILPTDDEGEPQPKLLWSYDIGEPRRLPFETLHPLFRTRRHPAEQQLFCMSDHYGNELGIAPLTTPEITAWISGTTLYVVETMTGRLRWVRAGMPPATCLAGTGETIVVIDPNSAQAQVFDGLDGSRRDKRDLKEWLQPQAEAARKNRYSPFLAGEIPTGWWVQGRYLYGERPLAADVATPATSQAELPFEFFCHDLVLGKDLWRKRLEPRTFIIPLDLQTCALLSKPAVESSPSVENSQGFIQLMNAQTGSLQGGQSAIHWPEKISRVIATLDRDRFYVGLSDAAAVRTEHQVLQLRNGHRQPFLTGEMVAFSRTTSGEAWRVKIEQEPWPLDISRVFPVIVRCWITPESPQNRGAVGHQRTQWAETGEFAVADDALFLSGYVVLEPGEGREILLKREYYTTTIIPPQIRHP